jgi:hypothetical protein
MRSLGPRGCAVSRNAVLAWTTTFSRNLGGFHHGILGRVVR